MLISGWRAWIIAGKLELVTVEFDLRTVLEDALDSVAGRAMMKVGQDAHSCNKSTYISPHSRVIIISLASI